MSLLEFDTSTGWSFGIEIDGVEIKQIQEVSGLKIEVDEIELKENTNDGKYVNRKLVGRPKAGEVTFTRGLTDNNSFEKWIQAACLGDLGGARKGGSVIVYDQMGSELKRYKLLECWPKTLEIGTMQAGGTDILTEKLTVTHEGVEAE